MIFLIIPDHIEILKPVFIYKSYANTLLQVAENINRKNASILSFVSSATRISRTI